LYGPILLFSTVGPILLVLVRSAQATHVVYTLYAELSFWCKVVLGVTHDCNCRPRPTCFLLFSFTVRYHNRTI